VNWARDLVWENIDMSYKTSVAYQFARYADRLDYDKLPPEVVHQAKRCLLDALGCAIGGYDAPGRPICEAAVQDLGGPAEAIVFGSGLRTSVSGATLVNSFLVRFLDANDMGGGGHGSDAIAAILAVSEREKANGREMLTSLVVSYELGARVEESLGGGAKGWTIDLRAGLIMPAALGKLLGLTETQIANAIGICACGSLPLGVADPHKDEHTMRKNLRFGWVSYDAIMACLLAKRGFTGPLLVVEGDHGWQEVILQGAMDLKVLTTFTGWRILRTRFKALSSAGVFHGTVFSTIAIVTEQDLSPDDIAEVRITCRHQDQPISVKMFPRNAESADHTPYYVNAVAIRDRALGADQFRVENFSDPTILELEEKIVVTTDPSMAMHEGKSEILTKDGRKFSHHTLTIPGSLENPLSDTDLEEKFREMAGKYLPELRIRHLLDTIWNVQDLDDVGTLTKLMIF
jgi:2-methylcitrate dehydratase